MTNAERARVRELTKRVADRVLTVVLRVVDDYQGLSEEKRLKLLTPGINALVDNEFEAWATAPASEMSVVDALSITASPAITELSLRDAALEIIQQAAADVAYRHPALVTELDKPE